ncbi:RING-H2 finger protein ATL78 [Cucumis sativus]|uniref:RING-type E3 ubiquitin transferase n=1 Tax=Cucumis sativus TaxID=3659 RepID=A0A0A0LQ73_CUCSA|nr:RING-H2 finger protein ATL78 [Cucumis sativus]KGN62136.1 hypothetical protein Csa_006555 [Cucumis sativus]
MSIASISTNYLYDELHQVFHYSRKLLLHSSLHKLSFTTTSAAPPSAVHDQSEFYSGGDSTTFDTNVVMVLSVLLCALICSLALNSIIRCALKCSRLIVSNDHRHRLTPTSTGVHKKAIKSFTVVQFSLDLNLPGLDPECVICLSEFATGDKLRLLPKCNHGFHVKCIDKWLSSHSSCPKCRQCLVQTCEKIAGVASASASASSSSSGHSPSPPPPPSVVVDLAPLEPEAPVRNLRL